MVSCASALRACGERAAVLPVLGALQLITLQKLEKTNVFRCFQCFRRVLARVSCRIRGVSAVSHGVWVVGMELRAQTKHLSRLDRQRKWEEALIYFRKLPRHATWSH